MKRTAVAERIGVIVLLIAVTAVLGVPARAQELALDKVLARASKQVADFLEQFSEVKCTEDVVQEKIGPKNKAERKAESTYDYLVILTNTGGELSLDESRLEIAQGKPKKSKDQSTPLLISNGFATLFLIFHPYYSDSFEFSLQGEETINGERFEKVHFQHLRNKRSPAALSVRGRLYPLDLSGTAWIQPQSGVIARITADVDGGAENIGMKAMKSEVNYAPVRFGGAPSAYWFPAQARVEVETARQRWVNTHTFSDYKRFSVSTEEQVAKQ
jgi:hypothetical protein